MLIHLTISLFVVLCGTVGSESFSYKDPDTEWGKESPTCNGDHQSPIDYPIFLVKEKPPIEDEILRRNNYENIPHSMKIVNTGHTIQVNPQWSSDSDRPSLSGGPLSGEYVVQEFHFHWGLTDDSGTEHTVEGKSSAVEFQMVHWKRDYGSYEEAVKNPDGVAVIAVAHHTEFFRESNGTEPIWRKLGSVERVNDEADVEPFPLSDLTIVKGGDFFVSYYGSLTTPGCNEAVTWLLAANLYSITTKEMEQIRSVELAHGDDHNQRPAQELNGREFTYYRSATGVEEWNSDPDSIRLF